MLSRQERVIIHLCLGLNWRALVSMGVYKTSSYWHMSSLPDACVCHTLAAWHCLSVISGHGKSSHPYLGQGRGGGGHHTAAVDGRPVPDILSHTQFHRNVRKTDTLPLSLSHLCKYVEPHRGPNIKGPLKKPLENLDSL